MTPYQVYEQAIKPLSAEEKLVVARLITDEVVPAPDPPAKARQPREFGVGRHLLADVDIDALLATPIDDMFSEYMPEDH